MKQDDLLNSLLASVGGRQKLWEMLQETFQRHPDYTSVARKALDPNLRGGQHG